MLSRNHPTSAPESTYAWLRLWTAVLIGTIGGVGMWSVVVVWLRSRGPAGRLQAA